MRTKISISHAYTTITLSFFPTIRRLTGVVFILCIVSRLHVIMLRSDIPVNILIIAVR